MEGEGRGGKVWGWGGGLSGNSTLLLNNVYTVYIQHGGEIISFPK